MLIMNRSISLHLDYILIPSLLTPSKTCNECEYPSSGTLNHDLYPFTSQGRLEGLDGILQ